LPGEIELSRDLGVGRNTLRHALRLLADRGVVKILPGVAVYVVKSADRDSDS
jgi:DNA-binding FadR family transcriptional regulator